MRDPSFSYSLAKISHDLTYGGLMQIASERRCLPQLLKELSPFSGYHEFGAPLKGDRTDD